MRINTGIVSPMRHFQTLNLGGENNYFVATGYAYSGYELTLSLTTVYFLPVFLGRRFALKKYGVVISNFTTAGLISLGFYEDNGSRQPSKRVEVVNNLSVAGTGFVSKTFATPFILARGKLYWAAVLMGLSGSFKARCGWWGIAPLSNFEYGTYPQNMNHGLYGSGITSLADPYAGGFGYTEYVPMVFMREANPDGS